MIYSQLDQLNLDNAAQENQAIENAGLLGGVTGGILGAVIGATIGSFTDNAPAGPAASPSALWASSGTVTWE